MAKIGDLDGTGWEDWVASRPEEVRALCRRFPPDRLYLLKSTNHRVTIYGYSDGGTMIVSVTGQYNLLDFERRVFGILPGDLEECDLPAPGEVLGALMKDRAAIDDHVARIGRRRRDPLR